MFAERPSLQVERQPTLGPVMLQVDYLPQPMPRRRWIWLVRLVRRCARTRATIRAWWLQVVAWPFEDQE